MQAFNLLFCGLLTFSMLTFPASIQAQVPPSIRFMSFNIRYDNPDDGPNAWKERKELVQSMIQFHEVDVLAVQEALPHQMQDLSSLLPQFQAVGIPRSPQSPEFCGIFFLKHRFELLDEGTFWLSETPDTVSRGWDAALPRICTWALLREYETGHHFYAFNTHFDHQGEEARMQSSKLIVTRIESLMRQAFRERNTGIATILMGDFNALPESGPIQTLTSTSFLKDSYSTSSMPPHGPDGTWSGWEVAGQPGRRIDYIFTNKSVTTIRQGTLSDSWSGRFPSDHLPILAECKLSPAPPLHHAHAHNDYEHERPLFDALHYGFTSVEADVWYLEGEFYVTHDRPLRLKQLPTLDSLYLRPLADWIYQHGGRVYPADEAPFWLMIDLKNDGEAAYQALTELLTPYQYLLEGSKPPLKIFLSGARPVSRMLADTSSVLGIDGRPEHLGKGITSHQMPVISQRFSKVVGWNGKGSISQADFQALQELCAQAHAEGKWVRLWATPEDEQVWETLLQAGVDLLNTDQLSRLAEFLTLPF